MTNLVILTYLSVPVDPCRPGAFGIAPLGEVVIRVYYHRQKKTPSPFPFNHLDTGAFRLSALAWHQPITCLISS